MIYHVQRAKDVLTTLTSQLEGERKGRLESEGNAKDLDKQLQVG